LITQPALPALPISLDSGETAAIALALALKADILLLDEKRARLAARGLNLAVGGVLGELLYARRRGWIANLRNEMQRLRQEAGFFIDAEIENIFCRKQANSIYRSG